ncbi:MAG TPA: multicopper oxidase domain-containing protein [Chitinophagaceae bacterium]|nr:multicopper oxidase domain-containing protein [Chitinophagaceae bacterium]HMU58690.1 multicopper oxidase domain-containing protein [Chitinophagaceae bacterium]
MKRRNFLKMSGLGAGAVVTSGSLAGFLVSCSGCKKEHHRGLMTEPVMITEGDFSKLLSFPSQAGINQTLTAQATTANPKGANIPVLGYQPNNLLGPSFKVNKGDAVNILLQNNLSEHTNIHWHGLKIPALMDGHPDQLVNAGSTFRYQFTVNQRAGLSWYHPHPHEKTGKQVFQGLAGLFIINDAEEAALNLPSGQYEIPLVIQDKRITGTGISYNPSMEEVMAGYMGESIVVNGVYSPYTEVATRYYRLRILNGSNARVYNLAFSNNADMIIIGNDGGLLKNPVTVKDILIAPGERLDVLVNFSRVSVGTEIFLVSKEFAHGGDAQGKQLFRIMKFKVTTAASDTFIVPSNLSTFNAIPASSSVKTRTFEISNAMEHDGMPMNDGMQMRHRINGKLFDSSRIDENVAANSNEIWVFDNSKGDEPHPMHLHGVFFQVLNRTGGRGDLISSENGWKDTVLVMPGERVRIIIPFENNTGKFVFHCHNLEHEDDGMMLQYQLS